MGWVIFGIVLAIYGFVSLALSLIQVGLTRRLIDLHDIKNLYDWMHAQPEFRSLNRIKTIDPQDDRKNRYAWTIAYVKEGKHQETERSFSPIGAIRLFRSLIEE